jgi:hypothetical protein
MATTKTPKENLNMDDFESLLSALSAEELENINDLVDPEVFIHLHMFVIIIFLLRILIYQQVIVVNHKQIKLQQVYMIVANF